MTVRLAPSMLAADPTRLGEAARWAQEAGADWLHVDVMDGSFVEAITFGDAMVAGLRRVVEIPLDVHLMVADPVRQVGRFIEAGAQRIGFHVEAVSVGEGKALLERIRAAGCAAGLAVNPATAVGILAPYVGLIDQVTVMTVEPGAGGQALLESTLGKFAEIRALVGSDVDLVADGGVKEANVARVAAAGATVLVAGSAVFAKYYTAESVATAVAGLRLAV